MKPSSLIPVLTAMVAAQMIAQAPTQPTIETMPAVVVKTVPQAGAKDVAPGTTQIQVTFSKEMMDGSWSWSSAWAGSDPQGLGKPSYDAQHRTCTLKVKLEPNKNYGYWLNSERFKNFKDKGGQPAIPYLLVFQTAAR